MKKLYLIISIIFILSSCRQSREERLSELHDSQSKYEQGISQEHKILIENIFNNDKYYETLDLEHKNNVLVMTELRGEIIPYVTINNKLSEIGFNILYDSNKLDYIVCVKYKGIKAGNYSDGSNAWDTQTEVYVIETSTNTSKLIATHLDKSPETISKPRNSTHNDYGSRGLEGNDLIDFIKNKI